MENGKVSNSEFADDQIEFNTGGPILGFLNRTILRKHTHLKASFISEPLSRTDSTVDSSCDLPRFTFKIHGHRVKDYIEYTVQLTENKTVRGRHCSSQYVFNTRYSKLLTLHERIKPQTTFPAKKLFNSKSGEFVEKRKQQLELYLNEIAKETNRTFEEFVGQIKKASNNSELDI